MVYKAQSLGYFQYSLEGCKSVQYDNAQGLGGRVSAVVVK